jgi:hypothetical protein
MSSIAIINRFDGGNSEDIRTTSTNESDSSVNFDIISNPHLLRAFPDQVAETISTGSTVITDFQITDVITVQIANALKLVALGRESAASSKLSFFTKDTPISTAWAKIATIANTETPQAGTLVEYKGQAYAVGNSATAHLYQFTTGASATDIGSMGTRDTETPKPFVHPEDNILYIGINNTIYTYNGTALALGLTLPTNVKITSLTNSGGYLAIAVRKVSFDSQLNALSTGSSLVYLWGRDTSLTTLQEIINWGTGDLMVLENINETLIGISQTKTIGAYDTIINYSYNIKIYNGGHPVLVKEFLMTTSNVLRHWKAKQYNKLYFCFDTDDAIYSCGLNKLGQYFVTKEKYLLNGNIITGTLNNFSIIGDIMFASYTDGGVAGYFTRTSDATYVNSSVYTTSINPAMAVGDRYENKQLVSVQIAYECNSTNGNITVGYYCEDESGTRFGTLQPILNITKTATGQYVSVAEADVNGDQFLTGREYKFRIATTGDVRIKELRYKYNKMNTI